MGYVTEDDVFSNQEDLSCSTVSDCFDDDDADDEGRIDDEILADLARPSDSRALQGHTLDVEKPVSAGIHVWPGVKDALEHTFDGWPDSAEYQAFCKVVRAELAKEKFKRVKDVEEFALNQSSDPMIDGYFKKFVSFPGNPIANSAKKLKYYKSVLKIMAKGVKYLGAETRQKYEVTLGAQLMRRGAVFCTESVCNRKAKNSIPGSQLASKLAGKNKRCIWVMTERADGEVSCYSHFGKIGAFHHSSFTGGDGIMAAGEWYVEQGKCTLINALSGHYKPEPWRFLRALKVLANKGVIRADTEVQVFTKFFPAGEETRLNAQEFLNDWTNKIANYNLYP